MRGSRTGIPLVAVQESGMAFKEGQTFPRFASAELMNSKTSSLALALSSTFLISFSATCFPATEDRAESTLPAAAAGEYLQGIEALQQADFQTAITHLSKSVQSAPDSPQLYQARGVAETLAEQFQAAISDLQRASQLDPQDRETKLWLSSAYRMAGHPEKGSFVHDGMPVNYANMVYNVMAMNYWSSMHGGRRYDAASDKYIPYTGVDKSLFPKAAAAYAERHKVSGPAAAELVQSRMKSNLEHGNASAAIPDLERLRQASPADVSLDSSWAMALLASGDARDARRELTRVLARQPFWADGYAGRAEAATILGDERRTKADLEFLAEISPKTVEKVRPQIVRLQKEWPQPAGDPETQFDKELAQKDVSWLSLVQDALALRRWENNRRQRYDEQYQDRIAELSLAAKKEPKEGQWRELLANFLFAYHIVPRLWDGPRGDGQPLRPQIQAEQNEELDRAIALADEALKLNPKDVNSIAVKALVAFSVRQDGTAEQLADQGLAIDGHNLRLLTLKNTLLLKHAAALSSRAGFLRMGHSETRRTTRSDGVYEEHIHYPPTAAELAEAEGLEAQASALRQQAQQLQAEATRIKSKVVPELLAQADSALKSKRAASARKALEEIYRYDADLPEWPERMAQLAGLENKLLAEKTFTLLAQPLNETSAADSLKAAWNSIQHTAYQHAQQSLAEAQKTDPADARVYAWRGSAAQAQGDQAAAEQQRRAGLALEEAKAYLMGTSFLTNSGAPLSLAECGLSLGLRLSEGQALLSQREDRPALEAFQDNLLLETRLGADQKVKLVPSAMLPEPQQQSETVPTAPSFGSLLAWSRLGAARALLDLNQPTEAAAQLRIIRQNAANWPATAPGRETLFVVDSWARLGLAQAAYESRDYEQAFRLLMSGEGWPWNLPPELTKDKDVLTQKVLQARKQRATFGWPWR